MAALPSRPDAAPLETLFPALAAAADFDPATMCWTGVPSYLIVADAVIQRPGTSHANSLKRIAHNTASPRIRVRKQFIHPGEVNRIR